MAGKANVITLNPDMTFTERKRPTESNNVVISKFSSPSFTLGTSVFSELIPRWKQVLFGRKPRRLLLWLSGANQCFRLDMTKQELESFKRDLWNQKEKEDFAKKLLAKQKADQKIIDTKQFFVIMAGIVILIFMQFLILRGLRVF